MGFPAATGHIGIMGMGGRTPVLCSHIMNMWNICIASITVTSFAVRSCQGVVPARRMVRRLRY